MIEFRSLFAAGVLLAVSPQLARAQDVGFEPFSELGGIVLSLFLVLGLILVGAWAMRRSPLGALSRRAGPLKLIASLPLGAKERLLLVEAGDCVLVIGVSPAGIFSLHRQGVTGEREPVPLENVSGAQFSGDLHSAALLGQVRPT